MFLILIKLINLDLQDIEIFKRSSKSTNFNVILVNYSKIVGNSSNKEFYQKHKFAAVFLDEGHMIKNKTNEMHKACSQIKREFSFIVTGTKLNKHLLWYY